MVASSSRRQHLSPAVGGKPYVHLTAVVIYRQTQQCKRACQVYCQEKSTWLVGNHRHVRWCIQRTLPIWTCVALVSAQAEYLLCHEEKYRLLAIEMYVEAAGWREQIQGCQPQDTSHTLWRVNSSCGQIRLDRVSQCLVVRRLTITTQLQCRTIGSFRNVLVNVYFIALAPTQIASLMWLSYCW